jgi:hypothetical protein
MFNYCTYKYIVCGNSNTYNPLDTVADSVLCSNPPSKGVHKQCSTRMFKIRATDVSSHLSHISIALTMSTGPLKLLKISTKLNGARSEKIVIFLMATVKNLKFYFGCLRYENCKWLNSETSRVMLVLVSYGLVNRHRHFEGRDCNYQITTYGFFPFTRLFIVNH